MAEIAGTVSLEDEDDAAEEGVVLIDNDDVVAQPPKKPAKGEGDDDDEEDDDTDDAAEGGDKGDAEDDDAKLSERTQRRMRKLSNDVRIANERAEAAERKAQAATAGEEESTVTGALAILEGEEKDLIAKLRAAKEAGDTDKEIELQGQWGDLKVDLKSARRAQERIERAKAADAEEGEGGQRRAEPRREGQRPAGAEPPPRFNRWLARNQWVKDPKFSFEAKGASAIEAELKNEGFDPTQADFYTELDRRCAERLQRVAKHQAESSAYQGRGTVAAATSASIPGLTKRQDGKLTYKMTAQDKADMRNWGLDPKDKVASEEWARSKIRGIRENKK